MLKTNCRCCQQFSCSMRRLEEMSRSEQMRLWCCEWTLSVGSPFGGRSFHDRVRLNSQQQGFPVKQQSRVRLRSSLVFSR